MIRIDRSVIASISSYKLDITLNGCPVWLKENGRHFADIFKCIFLNENIYILIKISLKFLLMILLTISHQCFR